MSLIELLTPFAGAWTGSNRLWMMPGTDPEESAGTATLSFSGQGKFAELRYTWATEGDPEDGGHGAGRAGGSEPDAGAGTSGLTGRKTKTSGSRMGSAATATSAESAPIPAMWSGCWMGTQ